MGRHIPPAYKKARKEINNKKKIMEENKYTKEELIFAIQEAYGHGRDEADDILWHQVEESIRVILKCIDDKRGLAGN